MDGVVLKTLREEVFMGNVIPIFSKKEVSSEVAEISEDSNQLLKVILKNARKKENSGEINIIASPREFVLAEISSFLLKNKMIDPELFRCTLYVSEVVSTYFTNVPESYYACDYFTKGIEENDPESIKKGADFCFLLCTFFPERGNRRVMKVESYFEMGKMMYFSLYGMTQKTIGLSMGNNFSTMVEIAKKVVIQ